MLRIQQKKTDRQQIQKDVALTEENYHSTKSLDELHRRSRSGLWGILVYLAASILAFYFKDLSLASVLPEHVMQKLGPVPPVFMATIVLWISTLSALSIIAGRFYHGTVPSNTTSHVAFRVGFYALFFMVGGLGQYINELFVSGLVVLALQHCNVFNYYSNLIETDFEGCTTLQKNSL
jgi:uncharacterized membrane protein YhaH (DUF805 family)